MMMMVELAEDLGAGTGSRHGSRSRHDNANHACNTGGDVRENGDAICRER